MQPPAGTVRRLSLNNADDIDDSVGDLIPVGTVRRLSLNNGTVALRERICRFGPSLGRDHTCVDERQMVHGLKHSVDECGLACSVRAGEHVQDGGAHRSVVVGFPVPPRTTARPFSSASDQVSRPR